MKITLPRANFLLLDVKLSGGNFKLLEGMPGHKKWDERKLLCRIVGANIEYILECWPDAEWDSHSSKHRDDYLASLAKAEDIKRQKQGTIVIEGDDYEYKRLPMKHQQEAFVLSRDEEHFGLFMEQGTGKTKVIIDTACYLYKQKKIEALIVIAWPNGVHRNWVDYEIVEDIPDWVDYEASYWSSNLTQKKIKEIRKVFDAKDKLKIMTFNVEAFTAQKAKDYILEIVKNNKCLVAIDQSASIKNPTAKRTKFLVDKVKPHAEYRRILDGAPVAEGAGELYSQFRFLNQDIIGHDTWTAFKAEYCKMGYFKQIIGYRNIERLHSKIDGYSFRVLADDCLDLPQRVYKRWRFDLSPNEMRIYNELKLKNLAFFKEDSTEEGVLEENLAMVKNMRLQQISSGWFPTLSENKLIDKASRIVALKSLLDQAEGKALIFSRFRADLELIQNTLGKSAVSYHGGISEDERGRNKHAFMTDDDIKYFVGQQRTAGIGHTLTAAKHVIFYSNDPSLRFREECEKRAHRKGIEKTLGKGEKLIIWDLIASKTHDAKLVRLLQNKKDISREVLHDPDNFFLVEDDDAD